MFIGIGSSIPEIVNLPGPSSGGGGGGGGGGLAKVNNLYSFEFDGVGTRFHAGDITALNNQSAFSTSSWINYSGTPAESTHVIASGGSSGTNRWWIQLISSTKIRYGMGGGSGSWDDVTVPSISSGSWNHIVSVQDGTSLDIYLNGIKQNSSPITARAVNSKIGTKFTIGKYFPDANAYYWYGKLDEIAVWNTALTQEQVESIYNATTTGKTADLNALTTVPVAWYRMGD